MWVFFFAFPGNEAYKLFLGGAKWGVFGRVPNKFMLKKIVFFFGPLSLACFFVHYAFSPGQTSHDSSFTT